MGTLYLNSSLYTLSAIILAITAVGTFFKRTLLANSGKFLLFFLILILTCCLILLALEISPGLVQPHWLAQIPSASLLLIIPPLVLIGRAGLQSQRPVWSVLLVWSVWLCLFVLALPQLGLINRLGGGRIDQKLVGILPSVILFIGWTVLHLLSFVDLKNGIQASISVLVRKRARLWVFVWANSLLGGALIFTGHTGWGLLSMSLGTAASVYLLVARDLPSPRFLFRLFIRYVILWGFFSLLLWVGLQILHTVQNNLTVNTDWLAISLLVLGWVSTAQLLFRFTAPILDRWLAIDRYNINHVLHNYSQQVSQLTSPGKITRVTIDLILATIRLDFGHVFEVFHEADGSNNTVRIEDSGGAGLLASTSLRLSSQNLVLEFFKTHKKPIYIDQLKTVLDLEKTSPEERAWFTDPKIELFIPIHSKAEWIGLFALGEKKSGGPYSMQDYTLLNTLANQLSFALQNARMVDMLMRINNDFRRTYAVMDQSNQQLQQAYNQLEKMDQTKSDFISVASHELRTPLTVMRGYNEMLLEDPSINANPYQLRMVKGLNSGLMRMQEVIESILDVASIDSRALHLQKEPLAINQVLQETIESYQTALTERNIQVHLDYLEDLPSLIADKAALDKVFNQLLSNAIKYTPDGGSINISGSLLSSKQDEVEEDGIEIVIRDSGIGIDNDQLQLIFKKFYQTNSVDLHSTGKTKYKGSGPGLGLAIAKGIIHAHGGKIWAESPGHDEERCPGSQIHILLPLSRVLKPDILPR
jgi:signal transduction histidine kinase